MDVPLTTQPFPVSPASSTPTSSLTWITWFCSLPGHEYFCEVTEDFIEDDFNLTGLNALVPFWKEAMEMVLDVEPGETPTRARSSWLCTDVWMNQRMRSKYRTCPSLNRQRNCFTDLFTSDTSSQGQVYRPWYAYCISRTRRGDNILP